MSVTPVKTLKRCVFCLQSYNKLFPFFGKKINDSQFISELVTANCCLPGNWQETLKDKNAAIYKSCFNKFENFSTFISIAKENLSDLLVRNSDGTSFKRLHSPPTSQSSTPDDATPTLPVASTSENVPKKSLKRRKLIFPTASGHFSSTEHSYSTMHKTELPSKANTTTIEKSERKERMIQKMLEVRKDESLEGLNQQLNAISCNDNSILSKCRPLNDLQQEGKDQMMDMLEELVEKAPILFNVLVATAGKISTSVLAPISSVYGLLMFQRNHMMSAWQRCISAVCLKGQLEDSALTKLSQYGLALSPTSKLRLQDEAGIASKKLIVNMLSCNPLAKITGDNLDVYIKRDVITATTRNKDLHLFASNIILPRIANTTISNEQPSKLPHISAKNLEIKSQQRVHLINSYKAIIANIFAKNIDGCGWMCDVLQINHKYDNYMSQKSQTAQLPIIDANESKHEDCLKIMDHYETVLTQLYNEAHGSDEKLRQFQVVTGGDQLTRIRLNESKALRSLSPNYKKRFEDINPIVVELWHVKQDLLEKFYKAMYDKGSVRAEGSLAYFKAKLQRTDVSGKVKGHFKSHMAFLSFIGESVIAEQGRQFISDLDIEIEDGDDKFEALNEILDLFISKFDYVPSVNDNVFLCHEKDEMYNYFNNLAQWFVHIELLNKTAKDGDINSIIPNLLMSLPLFYNHSTLSKYLVECINYVIQVEYVLSPLMKLRVLEGSFVNVKGGRSNNVESDLLQEHSVRNQKCLIKQLGANKTQKAIERASAAAGAIAAINDNIAISLEITPKSSRHTKTLSPGEQQVVSDVLKNLKPFKFTPGRKYEGFEKLGENVFACIDGNKMKIDLDIIVNRLLSGHVDFGNDDIESNSDSDSDDDDLPDL